MGPLCLKMLCQHSLLLPHLGPTHWGKLSAHSVSSVPFLATSGGTLPYGSFCHFLLELELALKPAWHFRGRQVKAVQGMWVGSVWRCTRAARESSFIFVPNI